MAIIELDPTIPNNVVCLPSTKPELIRKCYERGDLVILSDVRIGSDFDCIAAAEPSEDLVVRKQKFIFRKSVGGKSEDRQSIWRLFFSDLSGSEPALSKRVQTEIRSVDRQVDTLLRQIFHDHEFSRDFTAWKFLNITGENLHIDNLPNLNETTQVRMFVNMDNRSRDWSLGQHWRHYAQRYFLSDDLQSVSDDAFAFNGKLNHAAFGPSWSTCDEPRHLIVFEPGEVWLLNSAITAHQVRSGRRLCSAHYEYPYEKCIAQNETLPSLIAELGRKNAATRFGPPLRRLRNFMRLGTR